MIDLDKYEERAAIMQFDGGLTQFAAETAAAKEQGHTRYEVIHHAKRKRDTIEEPHHGEAASWDSQNHLSRLQPRT